MFENIFKKNYYDILKNYIFLMMQKYFKEKKLRRKKLGKKNFVKKKIS